MSIVTGIVSAIDNTIISSYNVEVMDTWSTHDSRTTAILTQILIYSGVLKGATTCRAHLSADNINYSRIIHESGNWRVGVCGTR